MSTGALKFSKGWLASQAGHRLGSLGLLAVMAGLGLMLMGRRPFAQVMAGGLVCAAAAFLGGCYARRWGEKGTDGLIAFNATVMLIAIAAMTLARTGWGHVVGRVAL